MTTTVGAIYARISNKDVKTPKVKNQIATCLKLAELDGVTVPEENIFLDDGIAASGKEIDDTTIQNRPGAQALLQAMKNKKFTRLYATEGERLARTIRDGVEFIATSADSGITWHLDTDGLIDPTTPAGEATAMDIFMSGRREGRVRDERQRRRYEREIAAGLPLWTPRPLGYKKDRISVKESEAKHIREAIEQYLANDTSMIKIAKHWTEIGLHTQAMKKGTASTTWTATLVRQVILRPRNAGILVHRGVEQPVSQIEPIITREQHEQLLARIKVGTPKGARAESLLGGILRCECGSPMHATTSYSQRKGGKRYVYRNYKCSRTIYDKGHPHASIKAETADEAFMHRLLWIFLTSDFTQTEVSTTGKAFQALTDALRELRENITYKEEQLLDSGLKKMHAKIKNEYLKLQAEEEDLIRQRDVLLSTPDNFSALHSFASQWEKGIEGFNAKENYEAWKQEFDRVWSNLTLEHKRAMFKARFNPTVKCGTVDGNKKLKGAQRISFNPIT